MFQESIDLEADNEDIFRIVPHLDKTERLAGKG
jgi:hypothetical protein